MTAKPHHTYFIRTFGCQMNEHDSGKMANLLRAHGYSPAPAIDDADVVLFNTCTIREKAYHKAESQIGRALHFKRDRGAVIGVCGCVAQQEGAGLRTRFGHIDFIFGPDQLAQLPDMIRSARAGVASTALAFIDDPDDPRFPHAIAEGEVQGGCAFVAISKGCDGACSYCIVPRVRGKEVSRSADEIIAEVRELARRGAFEVTLLGQNVNSYGGRRAGIGTSSPFTALIRRIARETDVRRIRFTSPHPRDVDASLIDLYADCDKLCPHIHLPLQAGGNRTLARMRRGYTRERFMDIVAALRRARPGMSVTTDVIVGFCGEDDDDAIATLDLMERVRFDSIFAFCYSPRPGTYAAEHLKDDVPDDVKGSRLERVLALQREIQSALNKSRIGSQMSVVVVKRDDKVSGGLTGRAGDNRLVHFAGHERLIGSIVNVRITDASVHSLQGEIEHDG